MPALSSWFQEWLGPEPSTRPGHLVPRWLFLRALGLIFFSAFYSYLFQIQGLIGAHGILPAVDYLSYLAQHVGFARYWYAPTLLWWGNTNQALQILCWAGIVASAALTINFWPRLSLAVCIAIFLSFIAASQDFASYQSDGMLLEAAFISLFFVPSGWRPGFGDNDAPSRASLFLLQWEWFRIYFESGLVKILGGDPHWRHLTAMDDYYQNGPLPTWIGWYVQQCLPHGVHAATALLTLIVELGVVWMLFLPRRFRLTCFCFLFFFQAGIILTANYAFLNYIVVALSILLLDDDFLGWFRRIPLPTFLAITRKVRERIKVRDSIDVSHPSSQPSLPNGGLSLPTTHEEGALKGEGVRKILAGLFLGWVFYATTARMLLIVSRNLPLPTAPILALEPFRFANQYGLFAVMTPERNEIEFQGSMDGKNWVSYPFRYKPQNIYEAPGIYAPYQPRFEWNLWFASLGSWRDYPWVVQTEARLLQGSPTVLSLFRSNPFSRNPPVYVRAIISHYWFTDPAAHKRDGSWWRREGRGLYAPELKISVLGKIEMVQDAPPQ